MSTITLQDVGVIVAKIVEPPILMSRILAFVLAASVVVLAVLVITLIKMIPLERPEVFFLLTPTTHSVNTVIEPLDPDTINNKEAIYAYQQGFIREYVIARNTLYDNAVLTRNNWIEIVKPWSSKKVFSAFTNTKLYRDYTFTNRPPQLSCSVNFSDKNAIIMTKSTSATDNEYTVNFAWICENSGGQTTQKNYKIRIKIQSDLDKTVSDLKKLTVNPLGIQVTEYEIQDHKEDPLNSDTASW